VTAIHLDRDHSFRYPAVVVSRKAITPAKGAAMSHCSHGLRVAVCLLVFTWAAVSGEPPGDKAPARTDSYGDPLPEGAVARLGTVRLRHGDDVLAVAFSPDGKALASVGLDGAVSIWDPATGKELRRIQEEKRSCTAVAWGAGGKELVVAGNDWVRRWDAATGERLKSFPRPFNSDVTISADGTLAATFTGDEPVRIWDAVEGKELRSFGPKLTFQARAAFSPNAGLLAVGYGREGACAVWNAAAGKEVCQFGRKGDSTAALAFSPDGKTVAQAVEGSKVLRFWDAATGEATRELKGYQTLLSRLAFSPDGKMFAVGDFRGSVSLWNVETGKLHCTFGDLDGVRSLAFSPDGKTLAEGGDQRRIRLWDVATGNDLHPEGEKDGPVYHAAFSPDGKVMAAAGPGRAVALWDAAAWKPLRACEEFPDAVMSLRFRADGKTLATTHWNRVISGRGFRYTVRTVDVATGKESGRFEVSGFAGSPGAALSPDAGTAVFGDQDGSIQLWDVIKGKQRRTIQGPEGAVAQFHYSADGMTLAAVVGSISVGLWDAESGKELAFHGKLSIGRLNCFALSPDGKSFAAVVLDKPTIHLWDAGTGKELKTFEGHEGEVTALTFSPDGKSLLSGGSDRTVRLWDVGTGKERRVLRGHRGDVRLAVFGPDGKTAVTSARDMTVLIWDLSGTGGE
jgi:WD40 repeat protein